MDLVAELAAWTAVPLPERVAALNHEPVDYTVKDDAVVIRLGDLLVRAGVGPFFGPLGQTDEVGYRVWDFLVEETNREVSFARDELCIDCQCVSPAMTVYLNGGASWLSTIYDPPSGGIQFFRGSHASHSRGSRRCRGRG